MKIVIAGCGNVGLSIVEQLSTEDHDITVIDTDATVVKDAIEKYDIKGICGSGASYDVLNDCDVAKADLLIACTSSDERNILCCMVGKKLGVADTIARIRNPEYFTLFVGNELGLSMMVNPEYEAAMEIFRILRFPAAIKVEPFADGKVEMVTLRIESDNPIVDMTLSGIAHDYQTKILVCAIERGEKVIIPKGDVILQAGDKIHITGSPKEIFNFFKTLGILKSNFKKVFIVGGDRIVYYLCTELKKLNVNVKVVEMDREKCLQLADKLPSTDIINGDGADQELLEEEGLQNADAFVALTDSDEKNIMMSMHAKDKGVKKVITKLKQIGYYSILEGKSIDSIILPKVLTANQITRYVRGKENSGGSRIVGLYSLFLGQAEAVEFIAGSSFKYLSVPIKFIGVKNHIIIASLIRQGEVITPNGDDSIEENDRVIVVSDGELLEDLNDILEENR